MTHKLCDSRGYSEPRIPGQGSVSPLDVCAHTHMHWLEKRRVGHGLGGPFWMVSCFCPLLVPSPFLTAFGELLLRPHCAGGGG